MGDSFNMVLKAINSGALINRAGGVAYQISPKDLIWRVLILGTDDNTYYATSENMTYEAFSRVAPYVKENVVETVNQILEVSTRRLAPRNIHAVRLLAIAAYYARNASERDAVKSAVTQVIRHGGELLEFVNVLDSLCDGSWGRFKRSLVKTWLDSKPPLDLAHTLLKYAHRSSWRMRDMLRVAHPAPKSPEVSRIYKFVTAPPALENLRHAELSQEVFSLFRAALLMKQATSEDEVVAIMREQCVPREFVPDTFYHSAKVWEALIPNMPVLALQRALPVITRAGALNEHTLSVIESKFERDYMRIHPLRWYYSSAVYEAGSGMGANRWEPNPTLVNMMHRYTDASFHNYRRAFGDDVLVAIDGSGSMFVEVRRAGNKMAIELAAAMAYFVSSSNTIVFDDRPVAIKKIERFSSRSVNDFVNLVISKCSDGDTDISLPFQYATTTSNNPSAIVVFTDNERWSNKYGRDVGCYIQQMFRPKFPDTKIVLCAITATHYSFAPSDTKVLNVAGFDPSIPEVIEVFLAGEKAGEDSVDED